jgi:hypothetical protein
MVCQVMFTTPDVDPEPVEVEVELDVVEAAGPPQAARVSTALVASSAAGAVQLLARRLRGMLSVTVTPFLGALLSLPVALLLIFCSGSQFGVTCVSAHIHGRIVTAHNLIVKGAAVTI